jgi:hypothetical protein
MKKHSKFVYINAVYHCNVILIKLWLQYLPLLINIKNTKKYMLCQIGGGGGGGASCICTSKTIVQ